VRGLIEILEYSESFGPRYHGNIVTFAEVLWEDLGEFEERTGKIDKDLIYELCAGRGNILHYFRSPQ
jgi:hypothetical protein